MKRPGSSVPAFHSSATRRSVRLTRASVTSGMADRPPFDLGHAAGAVNAFDREIDMLDALARGPDVVREIPRDVHVEVLQFRITRLRDRNTRVPRASPSITRSHWPGATDAASPR
ncbi:hypothetical protein ABH985_001234 [Bradyrhizobium ottawaense]